MKYAFIESHRGEHAVSRMCRWLELSRSGYYAWRGREPSGRAHRREALRLEVEQTYFEFNRIYGSPRITRELTERGVPCSENHVAELLRDSGLRARNGKAFKYSPSVEAMAGVSENLLGRDFSARRPNEKWVSDITYIELEDGWVYLAAIMDLYSRQIVGWAVDDQMKVDLVLEAFEMAVASRDARPGLLLHSDRGVQYRAVEYAAVLEAKQVRVSMSRKGNCWDNAAMEAFFSRLKVEWVYATDYRDLDEAYRSIFEYIEVFYNRVRKHSAIGYVSPVQHEERYYAECA